MLLKIARHNWNTEGIALLVWFEKWNIGERENGKGQVKKRQDRKNNKKVTRIESNSKLKQNENLYRVSTVEPKKPATTSKHQCFSISAENNCQTFTHIQSKEWTKRVNKLLGVFVSYGQAHTFTHTLTHTDTHKEYETPTVPPLPVVQKYSRKQNIRWYNQLRNWSIKEPIQYNRYIQFRVITVNRTSRFRQTFNINEL